MNCLVIVLLFLKIVTACEEVDPNPESALDVKYLKIASESCSPIMELHLCKRRVKMIEHGAAVTDIRTAQIALAKAKLDLIQIRGANAPYRLKFDSVLIDVDSIKVSQSRFNYSSDQYYLYSIIALTSSLLALCLSIIAPVSRRPIDNRD